MKKPAVPRKPKSTLIPGSLRYCYAVVLLLSNLAFGEVPLPEKTDWKYADGTSFEGTARDFAYQLYFLQRRGGKLQLNGQELSNPVSVGGMPLFVAGGGADKLLPLLCENFGVPLHDENKLHQFLAGRPFAQVILPYYTLCYTTPQGRDNQVPVALLHGSDINLLRPAFDDWIQRKQAEQQAFLEKIQTARNQQMMLAMQLQALRAQQSMAMSHRDLANAQQQEADALKRIADKLD